VYGLVALGRARSGLSRARSGLGAVSSRGCRWSGDDRRVDPTPCWRCWRPRPCLSWRWKMDRASQTCGFQESAALQLQRRGAAVTAVQSYMDGSFPTLVAWEMC
jgi:hypothetical protein